MRSIWKGSVSFGLVNIPVKLYSATQQSTLNLDMVDRRDMGKVRFKRINENTGKEITMENIGKAYKYNGDYILLDDEDFEAAAPEKSKIIEVNNFVNEDEIDTIYFENSYYIEPEKAGEKAYALLREALSKSGKVGLAQFVLRTSATLSVLKPMKDVLVLSKIRFAEEIRSSEELKLPPKSLVKPEELKMAVSLINQYSQPFDIDKFKDEYAASLLKVIEDRASGKKGKVRKMKVTYTKTDNLMDQLKASLEKSKAS
ncbi:MAG TPA: Ku protein [Bacteroidales bacterium]|jgi:DNA end-binding protein Ku|nr:Ku protein [Bacteroidales bacterium]